MVLNRRHTADLEDERQRVQANGGGLACTGHGWRLEPTGLQVTRALGDKHTPGVTPMPEATHVTLCPEDNFIILATDGLWDVVSEQDACDIVRDTVKDPTLCAKRLVMEAIGRGSMDNVTVVVVFLQAVTTCEMFHGQTTCCVQEPTDSP